MQVQFVESYDLGNWNYCYRIIAPKFSERENISLDKYVLNEILL